MPTTAHPPWNSWYGRTAWLKRHKYQLAIEPFCRICTAQGRLGIVATEVDHVEPHGGDWMKFRLGAVQSLCSDCHKRKRGSDTRGYSRDIGADGWPIDPRHPCYGGKREPDETPTPPPPVLIG